MKDNISTLYGALKNKGYTDIGKDETEFRDWLGREGNVRTLYSALSKQGFDDIGDEQQFTDWVGMKPKSVSEDNAAFDENVKLAQQGLPTNKVTTQSMIDANPDLGLGELPYQYKPEVQKHIAENIPSMFKSNNASLMDKPLGDSASLPELSDDKFQARIDVAQKNLQDPEVQKARTDAHLRGLSASVDTDLNDIEDRIVQRKKAVRNENWKPGMPSSRNDRGLSELRGERSYLEGAKELIEESQKIVTAANDEKDGTFVGGVLRGVRDKAFDVDNWTMGISDLVGGLRLKKVLEDYEAGKQLSPAQEKLLDAAITNMATSAWFESDLGRGYKAGQVTGESLPFMLEMMVNPISASGNAMAKSLLTAGLKRFGSVATNKAVKAGTRLATDALAATGMAATTGLPGVLGESVDRMNRNYEYGFDADGNLNVTKTGDTSLGEALGRSFITRALENQSEMIFNAFRGAGAMMRGVERYIPGGVNRFFDAVSNSKVGQLWREIKNSPLRKEIAQAAQIGGIGEEYLEEVYNNMANVALGEMSFEEAIDLDRNIDTFLGLAPTQVMFSMLGLGNMAAVRYQTRRDIDRLRKGMTEEQQSKLDELLSMGTIENGVDVRGFIRNVMADNSLTPEQKRTSIEAAYDVAKQNAIDEITNTDIEDTIESENASIDAATDPQTGMYGEVTMIDHDENGEQVDVTVNVYGEKVVNGKLYLLVEKDGQKEYIRPMQYYPETYQKRPAEEVKALNEEMIREESAAQAELESKYAPEVLSAQMQQGVPFNTPTSQIVPVSPMPEGNGWIVEEYAMDENGNPSKNVNVRELTNDEYRDMLQAQLDANEVAQAESMKVEESNQAIVDNMKPKAMNDGTGRVMQPKGVQGDKVVYDIVDANGTVLEEGSMDAAQYNEVNTPETSGENVSSVEVAQQPQVEVQQAPVIPTKDDGSIDFVSYGKEGSFKTLGERYGEKMPNKVAVTAKAFAEDVAKAQTKLDKAQEAYDNAPIGREEKAEKALEKARQEFEAIKKEADFWAEMDAEIKAEQSKPGEDVAEEILSVEEPLNGSEFAAQMLANGNIKLLKDSFESETGFGKEEAKKYFGLFSSPEKGGMTIQKAGEMLMQSDRENGTNFFDQNDPNAGRNAIIEVLGIGKTKKDLANIISNNRAEQARKEQEAEFAAYEAWVEDNFHMSVSDYDAYRSSYARVLAQSSLNDDEYNEFMSAFVDETINNNQDEQGIIAESEGSSEVLSEPQSVQAERSGKIEEGSVEFDGNVIEEDGTLPKGTSGSEVINKEVIWTAPAVGHDSTTENKEVASSITGEIGSTGSTSENSSHIPFDNKDSNLSENNKENQENGANQIEKAREDVDQDPTDAQKEAGNYKKGHVKIDGYDITIENPKGGVRSGTDKNGKEWSITMNNDYGYIRGTEAVDGDHIDIFLSDNPTEGNVFVVDQLNEDGTFDESKVMYGFNSLEEARQAYLSNYENGWESRIMAITEVSKDEFKKWIDSSHRKTKAFAEYKSVKAVSGQSSEVGQTEEQKPYTIEPATYTTKKGKVLDMFLVKPTSNEMSRERQSEARILAKDMRGWYDRNEGGWMLRSESDAQKFVEKVFGDMHSESFDLITMKSVTDGDVSFSEPVKADEYSPTWQYVVSVDKESGFTTLRRDDVSGPIPIGDARFTIQATSPEEMLDILRNPLNGMQEALEAVEVTLENKIKARELDRRIEEDRKRAYEALQANGINGFKIGDKVIYTPKDKTRKPIEATIHEFEEYGEHNPVLDTGLAPVLYEVVEWGDISKKDKPKVQRPQEGDIYKNNMAGGDAVALIRGVGKTAYVVAFASDLEDAQGGLFMGDKIVSFEEMDKWLDNGSFTKIEKKKEYHGGERVFSLKHNTNKDILAVHHTGDKVEYTFTDGTKANQDEVHDALPLAEPINKPKEKAANPSGNKLVTDERYAELRERMKKKLGGQMNIGIDPEILAIGTEMAVYHIEKGARKFAEYAKAMIEDLGDAIRPYLKAFYNGARDLPEMQSEGLTDEMTPYEDVSSFDVANFDKAFTDVLATAETIVKEQEVEEQVKVAKVRVKKQSKPKKKTKENVSLLGDLFNQNTEENDDGRRNRTETSGTLSGNGRTVHDTGTEGNPTEDAILGIQTREEDSKSNRRRPDTSVHGRDVSDKNGSNRVHGSSSEQPVKRNTNNFSFGEGHIEVPSGEIAKLKANIEAIKTLKEIEASGKPATDAQKKALTKYVGWGGLANALDEQKFLYSKGWQADRNWNEKFLPYYIQIREILTEEEFKDAVQSTLTSHYTPEEVIRGLWAIVESTGFKGGRISEPAAGIGHILGLMPEGISERSIISGTELDSISGRIAKVLYPDAQIKVQGYEKEFAPKSKDLVITNVPFGKTAPYDKALDKALKKKLGTSYNLHNYFIAKGLLELKEGGIGVFVTSSATMDGANSSFREWVASNGIDLIGGIRLPNNAFLKNAGTSVTADILVFKKRKEGQPTNGVRFTSITEIGEGRYKDGTEMKTKPIMVNEYFAEHPEMMLGKMMTAHDAGSGGLYSGASQTLVGNKDADLNVDLANSILRLGSIDGILSESQNSIAQETESQVTDLKNGTLVVDGNNVSVAMNGVLQPIESIEKKKDFTFNGKKRKYVDAVKDYNSLKDTLKELIQAEQSSETNPEPIRKKLNKQYDSFVSNYGTLNRNKALDDVFAEDFEHNLPLSLEDVKRVPSPTGKSMVWVVTKGKGILEKRVSFPVEEPTKAENMQDAINISRSYHGIIDVPYIASLVGRTEDEAIDEMLNEGTAYRDPLTGNLVDKGSYLSGNVKEKLEVAQAMVEEHPEFQKNVEDLIKVLPETVRFGDISYRLGTPWIPEQYIDEFTEEVLGISSLEVQFVPTLNEFIFGKGARISDFSKSGQFRTDRVGVIDLLNYALNQRKPKIVDKITDWTPSGKVERKVPNEAETQAASEKIMEIADKFIEYIDGRKDIHKVLERIYNDKYNNYRLKQYELPSFSKPGKDKDGNDTIVTHYPNSNQEISLREHQAKAVQRCLSESTLLAHQVGTGKTFTMITTAMEMRRLGIAKKPMIVVQNATLEDFVKDFYKLYPGANVLAPGKDERSAENRKRLFNLIATGDFDAIVIPQSFMQFIPDDEGRKKELIEKRIDEYESVLESIEDYSIRKRMEKEIDSLRDSLEGNDSTKKKRSVKDRAKAESNIKAKIEQTLDRRTDDVLTFEQMGIDALFIDEAHNYKKIGFASKMGNVKGVDTSASQRANSLLLKAQYVQEKNGGRNVVLATGTPITNTMAEVWTMMKFVSPEIIEAYNIGSFDDFATTFGVVEPSLEFTATGNFKIADRFKSYVNVPELVKAFRSHTDVVLTSDVKEFKQSNNIPKMKDEKITNVVIEKNEDLEDVMQILIKKLEDYNNMSGEEKRRWSALPLVVFSRAKQAAIDLRLLNPSYEDNPNSKTNHVVKNVLKFYKESTAEKGAQMIFCDSYQSPGETPKMDLFDFNPDVPRFNLYEDIKQKLVEGGIPANEIAIVNNYDGERRKQLFEKVRNGDVRVLLGSTEKMGVGVNVQDRMYALHHIDAPIRPMDFEQRNGRILRQGNLYATWNIPVNVVTYGVQGTLDATAYDRLKTKQDFINQMMKGDVSGRVMEEQDDEDPSGMTFNQMAATLSDDKTAQLLFVAENNLKKLRNLKRSDANSKSSMSDSIRSEKGRLTYLNEKLKVWESANEIVQANFPDGVKSITVNGETISEKFGIALDPIVAEYEEAYSLNRGTAPLKMKLNDGKAEVIVHFNEGRMVYELYAGKEHIVESRQISGGKGLASSIEHQLKATKKNLEEVKEDISESKKKISGLEKAMSAPWGREDELKAAEQEVADLKKQLEEKALENSKKKTVDQPMNEVEITDNLERKGEGVFTENEVSMANDPVGKVLGKSTRTASERKSFAERERKRMVERVTSLSKKLGLNNVEIVTDANTLSGSQSRAKGFYSKSKRKITIVIPNHSSVFDAEQTLLHEAVAHYGLRELFGDHFDVFLNNVYRNASVEVRERIVQLAMRNGWDIPKATEEYLASLAENTNFEDMNESWWSKIKQLFLDMLHQIGFVDFNGVTLTDNELRYILWRSYENLVEPGKYRSIFSEASDIVMQSKLSVGNYAESNNAYSMVAEPGNHRSTPEDVIRGFEEIVYNHPEMYAIRTEEDIDALPTDRYTKRDIKEKFKNPRVTGTNVEGGMMILFVDRMDEDELRATIPHELAHYASRNMKIDDFYKMSALNYLSKNYSDEYKKVVDSYAKEKWGEEAVSHLFEKKVEELGFEKILNGKFDSRNDIGYIFYQITNFLNYGKRRRISGYRKGLSGQSYTGTESEGRGISQKTGILGNAERQVQRGTEESVPGYDRSGNDRELGSLSGTTMGMGYESREQVEENDTLYRPDLGGKLNIRDEYEATIKKGSYQAREAVQDSMLSLRRVQELIEKATGKKLRDFENAWMHENSLSSTVQSGIHEMERKFYKPMMDAVKKLMDSASLEQNEVADYLMLKHGIERNREMAVRKALTDSEGKIDKAQLERWYQEKQAIRNDANLDTWRKKQEAMDNAALNYGADMSRDYSGLTSMFDTDDLADCTEKAYDEVEALENLRPAETEALGKAVKAMTQSSLDKSFQSGLMDKKVYDELSNDMYDYYIPLRGFEETTSDEVYAYLDNERNAFNAPLMRAKGRTSKSDNPLAYMKSIAESGIMQGERNKMKQTFLNMVINNPSDLVSVKEGVWAVYNPATGEWEAASFPESLVPRNATPADVQAAYEKWEEDMELRAKTDPNVKKISEAADVPYRVIGNRMNQHQVIVKRLGKSYTLTINGNPRLAMALNGLTNPNNTSNDGKVSAFVIGKIDALNRTLSAWYTTRNPDFVASNFMRDTFYTNTIVRAKEGNGYANQFHKYYAKLLKPGKMLSLFYKYENGTLDASKPVEKDFLDFMMNGGETGYSNLKDLEHIKKQISKELNDSKWDELVTKLGLKGLRRDKVEALVKKMDILNRAVENTARFAAFRTSRRMGRTIAKSVFDAKEISVNFNKKGSGGTFFGATGQTTFGNLAAMVGAGGRAFYVFFNAAIQGTTNLMHVMKVNPMGTGAGIGAMFLMGAVIPYLFAGDDDDEKDYYDLPEHVRRNHLIIPGTGDAWVSIPLPIEYRIMYGMGELLTSWRTGHEKGENIGRKMLSLTGQALPLNFLEEGFDAFMPSALSPVWQIYNNESWTGLPIYKDTDFNKQDPEYTKAYKNVDRLLYNFSKAMYEWTFDEESQKARIDLNPAMMETLARGYFGGLATQLSNLGKTYETIAGEREFDWRSIPVANRLFKTGDERTKEKRITNEYFDNIEKLEFLQSRKRLLKKTKDGAAVPEEDKLRAEEDFKIMEGTDVYKKYMDFNDKKKKVDKVYRKRKEKDSKELETKYYNLMEEANRAVR